jgi:hypothetical protein
MATITQPTNENYLQNVHYKFVLKRTPHINYFSQAVTVPSISLPVAEQSSMFITAKHPGHKLTYQDFTLDFIVDEDLNNYMEIYNWMYTLGFPKDFNGYNNALKLPNVDKATFSDGSLFILNSNKQPKLEFIFENMFPVNLNELRLDTTQDNLQFITCSVSFAYLKYEVKKY